MSEPGAGRPAGAAEPPAGGGQDQRGLLGRPLGVPWLFAAAYSGVGFSLYIALGVVADRALSLTPLIFLIAGLLYGLTALTYLEGGAMFLERGGSASFARHAFNELVSFIAGWAILIDLLIVIALAAISVPHYLTPLGGFFGDEPAEFLVSAGVIGAAVALNAAGITGRRRQNALAGLAILDLAFQVLVIAIGLAVVMDPDALTAELDLFASPEFDDVLFAAVLATLAYAGIEAASNLAPELRWTPADLRRVVSVGSLTVPVLYTGLAVVAIMALPVTAVEGGAATPLGEEFIEAPVLGVVAQYEPGWLGDGLRYAVMVVAAVVLVWAAYTAMMGISRVSYTLATNRQIPSWMGRLGKRTTAPFVVIATAGALALALALPADIEFLAGLYAFGATLAITIAHLSVIRLRATEPDRPRPFRIPLGVRIRGVEMPLPTLAGALIGAVAWLSVLVLHEDARWVGGGWMAFGLVYYVGYRLFEGVPVLRQVEVSPEALKKLKRDVAYRRILVPVFGTELDDEIVGTAGRLGVAVAEEDRHQAVNLEIVYVWAVPVTLPLDARIDQERLIKGKDALARALQVADEYEGVNVDTREMRARTVGSGILEAAEEFDAEVIVMGGEPPSGIRYVGSSRPPEIGEITEYVLERAHCRVLLTAPPAEDEEEIAGPAAGAPA